MHVSRLQQLTHRGVDEGISRAARGPFVEKGWVVIPFDVGVFRFERFVHTDVGPMGEDMFVEIPPGEFGDPGFDARVAGVEEGGGGVCGLGVVDGGAGAEGPRGEVHGEDGGAVGGGEVAGFFVGGHFFGEEFGEAGGGFDFAGGPEVVETGLFGGGEGFVGWS